MRLRGIGTRLSAALLLLVVGALGIVYLVVVPSLERRLVGAKLSQLARAAPSLARQLPEDRFQWPDFVADASGSANARVVVYGYFSPPPTLSVLGDSNPVSSTDVETDPVALRAARTLAAARGTITRGDERFAEAAVPVGRNGSIVLLLSASLEDPLGNVHLVRRRLLLAGAIALGAALLAGYVGASLFARRVRRLERAADRIAGGRLDEPVRDRGQDELGALADAFERMRARLAQLDHARREFVANASHELRTPIFSLGGSLELLADEELDEATRGEFLDTMRTQVERLTKLATDLLDLSRLDAGQLHVELGALDLAELAESVVEEFRPLAADHRLELRAGEPVAAVGDELRALQIGRILVENALRHTPPSTTVRVSAGRDGGAATLLVEDDGPGLAPEHAAHVFERFYRGESSMASGSGLGLAIARELAEVMGGTLELESRLGRTAFRLGLPGAEHGDGRVSEVVGAAAS
ncbi:MAG: sensor histidine kinase [Gaiellaceae bacterium]